MKYKYYRMRAIGLALVCLALWAGVLVALEPTADVQLFPNTQNSPSIYLLQFTLKTALPSGSYLLVTMGWYSTSVLPYNCVLVNTTISISCSNLASLTALETQVKKFNVLLSSTLTVAVLLNSNLLANTPYALQVHLYNVIPSIQKISPSIEMYAVSSTGLVYEANPNFGSVINNPPNTNIMAVNVLNVLSSLNPGVSASLQVELTIGQAISTPLSTLTFVVQYPFTFSIGSMPTLAASTSYALNPIALYSKPATPTFTVVTPNVLTVVFNEQFVVGRKFIITIDQISAPIFIWSSNISIYSMNYNTLTPLQAFEGLYPISTVSYTLSPVLGLPYGAPFKGAMQYYRYRNQFIQMTMVIPSYSVPDGYSILMKLTSATFYYGSAYYSGLNSLAYTPSYNYVSSSVLVVSGMGPIVVGTTLTFNFKIYISTTSLFNLQVYIDTAAVISSFNAASYMYYGNVEGSGVATSSIWSNIYDGTFGYGDRVLYSTTYASNYLVVQIYQNVDSTATSSGAWLEIYLSPYVQVSPSFNQATDCRVNGVTGTCVMYSVIGTSYLKINISSTNASLNMFPYQTYTTIYLYKIIFTTTSSNQNVFPVYTTLYKTTGVAATPYYYYTNMHVMPSSSLFSGMTVSYINDYVTNTASLYQTYPGVLRLESKIFSQLNFAVQQDQRFVVVLYAIQGFRSLTVANNASYPCTSNIGVSCVYFVGQQGTTQLFGWDRIVIFFSDTSYATTNFHVLVPDMQFGQYNNYFYYQSGFYDKITKSIVFNCANYYYRQWNYWATGIATSYASMQGDMVGKAGSYRTNVSITVYNPSIATGGLSFVFLCTQWSFFENGVTAFSASTLAMATPATFGSTYMSPLSVYLQGGMYLTVIPITYVAGTTPFTFYLDNAHMPYTYDLPNYYMWVATYGTLYMVSQNSFLMTNGGTFYGCPLQSLIISCQDNAVGVVNTYCTVVFGTTNPLLASGSIRISLSGLTVSTSTCFLTTSNGTTIPVTCTTSSDKTNVTLSLTGSGFYTAGNFTLVFYGVGITSGTLSQSMTLYLYDSAVQYVIESGNRILTTTIATLSYITLNEILYAYLSPLSSNTMTISFYLPRSLYQDEQFTFVIGQDLSGVNTEVAKLNIIITMGNGTVLSALYQIDNVNNLIVFTFSNPAQLIAGNYTMVIYGIQTPASQSNGAFNMTYRRIYDFSSTIVNSANVAFPTFSTLITSSITLASYFNTEGYKQDIKFTLTNSVLNVDAKMVWIINFPSYYSSSLFQQDAYCMLNTAVVPCAADPNTPDQLIVSNSPTTVNAGVAYTLTVAGVAAPRSIYTNNVYANRYIFVGVLQNSSSESYAERALLLPYQTVQSTVAGVITVIDMIGVSASNLYSFSSIYAQFKLICNAIIPSGSYLFLDLPLKFDNLNNIAINVILLYGAAVNSSTALVQNRRLRISVGVSIAANSQFNLQIPDLPTPKSPCQVDMSEIIVTATPASTLSIFAASNSNGNSAPTLTFVANSLYVSFNHDQTIRITAGTYSAQIPITPSDNSSFLSNTNVQLKSTGFIFQPSTVFLPIGVSSGSFRIGADPALVPVVYFYTAIKQEEVNTHYQITLNMNIFVTNDPVTITLPTSIVMPLGGCSNPFLIKLTNPPYSDVSISFTFDNSLYSEANFYPNPSTTPASMVFSSTNDNNTFSICSSSSLVATQIPVTFFLSGTNYNSYKFMPSSQMLVNVTNAIANVTPTVQLLLNNQQKTFLDVNFTNNVDAMIFYHMQLGQNMSPLSLQAIQLNIKTNTWVLAAATDFMSQIYTTDVDDRVGQFFQTASTTTVRLSALVPQAFYTLCAYAVNVFSVSSTVTCLQLSTMTWGSVIKASIRFSQSLTAQQLNNVLCYFTIASGSSQGYLVDSQGNSCGNRSVVNVYYKYTGSSVTTEVSGTNIYLITNPNIIGTDPSPLAFYNLFSNTNGSLSATSLTSAQNLFIITYLSGTYSTSFSNARQMTASWQASSLKIYYITPAYNSDTQVLTVSNVQVVGGVGTVYFVLVLYKQISTNSTLTYVNIRMNAAPTAQQVLNCQNWLGTAAEGCARAVYTGVSSLTVTFPSVQANSLYLMYYFAASEFPLRPVVSGTVSVQTVVTYKFERFFSAFVLLLALMWLA